MNRTEIRSRRFCCGCGLHFAVNARHREDCTAVPPEDTLRGEIAAICREIDVRLGNPAGTAERGIYAWFWPATDPHSVEVLTTLHADAVCFLSEIVNPPEENQ